MFARFKMVKLPANNPSGSNCCPTRYMVELEINALLAPPGIGIVVTFPVVGSVPDVWFGVKIIGATGSSDTEDVVPPHSAPQFKT